MIRLVLISLTFITAAWSIETIPNQIAELKDLGGARLHQTLKESTPTYGLTDAVFPRTDPVTAAKIYRMLAVIDLILTKHKIPYWINGGTLLGAVRHQGLIPWDDDGDIEILASDWIKILFFEKEFKEYGYEIRIKDRRLCAINEDYPFIDIMLTEFDGDKVVFYEFRDIWPDNWFYKSELFPGQRIQFGPITLHAARNPERYLKAHFGEDCMEYAVCWRHKDETFKMFMSAVKVKVEDFSSAPFDQNFLE